MTQPTIPTALAIPAISLSSVMYLLFGFVILSVIIVSISLIYHWMHFSPSRAGAAITITIYTIGVAVFSIMLFSVLALM